MVSLNVEPAQWTSVLMRSDVREERRMLVDPFDGCLLRTQDALLRTLHRLAVLLDVADLFDHAREERVLCIQERHAELEARVIPSFAPGHPRMRLERRLHT